MSGAGDRPDELPAKIVAALDRLARGLRSDRQATASRLGISPLQGEVLRTLAAGPPPEPLVGLLAVELGVSQPTITDSLHALERKGLIERRRALADGRRTPISLAAAAAPVVDELAAADRALLGGVAALDTGRQEATLETLLGLIAHLVGTGTINVARTCLTCRFHEADPVGGHRCTLLDIDLPPAELRVNCREHEPAR